jgi:hypothetical protein
MKKIYLLLSFLSAFFLLSACSDDTEQCLYSPKVFDTGNLLSNKVKEEFLNFDYPAGIVPVLFAADSIEPIKILLSNISFLSLIEFLFNGSNSVSRTVNIISIRAILHLVSFSVTANIAHRFIISNT